MNLVITDHIDVTDEAKKKLRDMGATIYEDLPTVEDIKQRIKDADIVTANYIDLTPELIDAAPHLKYIVVPAVGYEWVDYKYAATKGIKVINCPTHNGLAVAEHAIGLMFAVQRHLLEANADLKVGNWRPKQFKGVELHGRQLGIVGNGKIGKRITAMAEALGMKVVSVNSQSSPEDWDMLFKESDVICVCLPQNDSTKHIVDAARLELVKPGAILINVGRGSTIDTTALISALQEGRLAAVGLDVYENEPLTGEPTPAIVQLANMPNVVATPHMAYNTHETVLRLSDELVADIEACLKDDPINVVN